MFIRFLLLAALLATFTVRSRVTADNGGHLDPNGVTVDDGRGIDPNGLLIDKGMGLDPNG